MSEDQEKFPSKEEWEAQQEQLRQQQNLGPGQVPEQRPQVATNGEPVDGEVQKRLREEGSPLADNAPAHGYEEHKRAASKAQAKKAERQSMGPERMFPGAHCYINNPDGEGKEHHGRACAVNSVAEYESPEDEALANAGYNANRRFARVKSYEVRTRDGRAELLIVDAEHLSRVPVTEFHRTVT